MAMKIARQSAYSGHVVVPTSGGLFMVSQDAAEINLLRKAVQDVMPRLHKGIPTYREEVGSTSKCSPRVDRAKPKPQPKPKMQDPTAKRKKDLSSTLKYSGPPKPVESEYYDDDRYALWWSFHTDLSVGEKNRGTGKPRICPLPASPKDRIEGYKRMRGSTESRIAINNLKAVGYTPRAHRKLPKLIGSTPHLSDPDVYATVVQFHKNYERELIARYCVKASVARSLPLIFGYEDHICDVTHQPVRTVSNTSAAVTPDVNTSDVIARLEQIVEADRQTVKVEAVTAKQAAYDNKLLRKEAEIFDLDITPPWESSAPASNDPDITASNPVSTVGEDQLLCPADILEMRKHEAWSNDEEIQYCLSLRRMECTEPSAVLETQFRYQVPPTCVYGSEGRHYLLWLRNNAHYRQREQVEQARASVIPTYDMKLGMEVAPFYHIEAAEYEKMMDYYYRKQLGNYHYELVTRDPFRVWSKLVDNRIINKVGESIPVTPTIVDDWLDFDDDKKEALVEKLVNKAVSQGATTVSEDSPTVNQSTAEIVSLADARKSREAGVANLIRKMTPKMRGLLASLKDISEDERLTLIAYLKASRQG